MKEPQDETPPPNRVRDEGRSRNFEGRRMVSRCRWEVPITRALFETFWLSAFGDFLQSKIELVDAYPTSFDLNRRPRPGVSENPRRANL